MKQVFGIFVVLGLAASLILPAARAQKPPTPPPTPINPPPGSGSSTRPITSLPSNTNPTDAPEDYVMFIAGQVATDDGSNLPTNTIVERVCNSKVRQQVYADPDGGFSMQLGSINDTTLDASADGSSQTALPNQYSETGIPRRMLDSCELRASATGFESPVVNMVELNPDGKMLEAGTLRVHRRSQVPGGTLNAAAYKGVPPAAITAYDKGLAAEQNGKLPSAQKHFEKAIALHPTYAYAWFQLGRVLQKQKDPAAARTAYQRASTLDQKLLAPHLALASLAYEERNWNDVLTFTAPILERDPFKDLKGYTFELEPFSYGETYYYNAVANYQLEKFDEAERSAHKAEQLLARSPQLHLLLSEIFARKKNYASALAELQTYLELDPHAADAEQVRGRMAQLDRLSKAAPGAPGPQSPHH